MGEEERIVIIRKIMELLVKYHLLSSEEEHLEKFDELADLDEEKLNHLYNYYMYKYKDER